MKNLIIKKGGKCKWCKGLLEIRSYITPPDRPSVFKKWSWCRKCKDRTKIK